jgi:hypothetical protein
MVVNLAQAMLAGSSLKAFLNELRANIVHSAANL